MTIAELRSLNDGKLPAYAWPGGYPILYLDKENSTLCPDCAQEPDGVFGDVVAWFIHYEGSPEQCEECGKMTDSVYGDPEEAS